MANDVGVELPNPPKIEISSTPLAMKNKFDEVKKPDQQLGGITNKEEVLNNIRKEMADLGKEERERKAKEFLDIVELNKDNKNLSLETPIYLVNYLIEDKHLDEAELKSMNSEEIKGLAKKFLGGSDPERAEKAKELSSRVESLQREYPFIEKITCKEIEKIAVLPKEDFESIFSNEFHGVIDAYNFTIKNKNNSFDNNFHSLISLDNEFSRQSFSKEDIDNMLHGDFQKVAKNIFINGFDGLIEENKEFVRQNFSEEDIEKISSDEFQKVVKRYKDGIYGVKGIAEINKNLSKEQIQRMSSDKFAEQVKKISQFFGWEEDWRFKQNSDWLKFSEELMEKVSSDEFQNYYKENCNFKLNNINKLEEIEWSPLKDSLLEEKLFFSKDTTNANLSFSYISKMPDKYGHGQESIWGRQRASQLVDVISYAMHGRPTGGGGYPGWEYLAAAREYYGKTPASDSGRFGTVGEESIRGAKIKLEFVRNKLALIPKLSRRFDDFFDKLEIWEKEGKEIKEKMPDQLLAGSYARYDGLDLDKSFKEMVPLSSDEYGKLHTHLDVSFKAVSQIGYRLKPAIENLYKFINNNEEDLEKIQRNFELLESRRHDYYSDKEMKDAEKIAGGEISQQIELIESIYNAPKGVYFGNPPLHGGGRGEDAPDWSERSYAFRDKAFLVMEEGENKRYVNVKEYHIGNSVAGNHENGMIEDLKLRLYSFSKDPDSKKLGELGFSVEVEKDGKTRFLNEEEIKNLSEDLGKYTLASLYANKAPYLEVKKVEEQLQK